MPSSDIALSFPLLLVPFTISIRWGWWWCWFVSTSAANGGLVGENQLPPWIPSSSRSWLPCGWSSALIQVNGLPSLVFSIRLCRTSPYLSTIPWSFSPLEGSGCPLHRSGTDRLRRGQVFHSHYPMFPVELVVLEDVDHVIEWSKMRVHFSLILRTVFMTLSPFRFVECNEGTSWMWFCVQKNG